MVIFYVDIVIFLQVIYNISCIMNTMYVKISLWNRFDGLCGII